jgi:syndetin
VRLEELSQSMSVPKASLWDSFCHVVTHVLVEGYSNAKKCSAAGRALMQLDFTHFISVLEVLSASKHPVHQKNYSSKHIIGLINCACNDKKLRQKLLSLVESGNEAKN